MDTLCQIIFNNNMKKQYYGGQHMSGRVILTLPTKTTIRGIFIQLNGKAYCSWIFKDRLYEGEEIYLSDRTYLLGGHGGEMDVMPGIYSFQFDCDLPKVLPASMEDVSGQIQYFVELTMDTLQEPCKIFKETFTVHKTLNLNDYPMLKHPIKLEIQKIFYAFCCICPQEPIYFSGSIPYSGFTPGQKIPVEIRIKNRSKTKITSVRVIVVGTTTYWASVAKKEKIFELCEHWAPDAGCDKGEEICHVVDVTVPPTIPTEINKLISTEYELIIWGFVDGSHDDIKLVIPITIGTIPIINITNNNNHPDALEQYDVCTEQPATVPTNLPIAPPYPTFNIESPSQILYPLPESPSSMKEGSTFLEKSDTEQQEKIIS